MPANFIDYESNGALPTFIGWMSRSKDYFSIRNTVCAQVM